MTDVIVHADDFGISAGATDRIVEAHLKGCLDRTSILPNGKAFDYAVGQLKKYTDLSYAVHLNLVEGKALSSRKKIPDLVNGRGFFKHTFFSLWILYLFCKNKREKLLEQIETEIYQQISRVRNALNCEKVILDSHQYLHMLPFILDILNRLLKERAIESIRIPCEPFFLARPFHINIWNIFSLNIIKHLLLNRLSKKGLRLIDRERISYPDYSIGVLFSGKMSFGVVQGAVSRLVKRKLFSDSKIEILFHPGLADSIDAPIWEGMSKRAGFYFSNNRLKEFKVLISPEFKNYIRMIKLAQYERGK